MTLHELLDGFGPIAELVDPTPPRPPQTFADVFAHASAQLAIGISGMVFAMRPAVREMTREVHAQLDSLETGLTPAVTYSGVRDRERARTRAYLRDVVQRTPHVFATDPVVLDLAYEGASRYE